MARSFDAEHLDRGIVKEGVEQPNRIRPTADRGDEQVGQAPGAFEQLRACFLTDHALKIANKFGIGVRAGGSTDDVKGCLLYTSPSPRDRTRSRMPSSA